MDWINELPLWLFIVITTLLAGCVLLFCLYMAARRERRQLLRMIERYQKQVDECRRITDESLEVAHKQSENAIFVLHRVLTEREKEEMLLRTDYGG